MIFENDKQVLSFLLEGHKLFNTDSKSVIYFNNLGNLIQYDLVQLYPKPISIVSILSNLKVLDDYEEWRYKEWWEEIKSPILCWKSVISETRTNVTLVRVLSGNYKCAIEPTVQLDTLEWVNVSDLVPLSDIEILKFCVDHVIEVNNVK